MRRKAAAAVATAIRDGDGRLAGMAIARTMIKWRHTPEFAESLRSEGEWVPIDDNPSEEARRTWLRQMTDSWTSEDGKLRVLSRDFSCTWGAMTLLTVWSKEGEPPWTSKQEIKDHFAGENRIAVEVFPAKKDLEDFGSFYHLWVLPKDFTLPFNLKDFGGSRC